MKMKTLGMDNPNRPSHKTIHSHQPLEGRAKTIAVEKKECPIWLMIPVTSNRWVRARARDRERKAAARMRRSSCCNGTDRAWWIALSRRHSNGNTTSAVAQAGPVSTTGGWSKGLHPASRPTTDAMGWMGSPLEGKMKD